MPRFFFASATVNPLEFACNHRDDVNDEEEDDNNEDYDDEDDE